MKTLEFIPFERARGIESFNTYAIANEYNDATHVVEALAKSWNIDIDDYEKVIVYDVIDNYMLPVDVIWFHEV